MTAPREMQFLLAKPEQRVLTALAQRVPRAIRSNHLTALGMIGAAGAGAAYALSNYNPAWLWAASLLLVVNWLCRHPDGTPPRGPGAQRPQYRYHLHHVLGA